MQINKIQTLSVNSIDKSNVFVEVHSYSWKYPNKISLEDLIKSAVTSAPLESKKYDISSDIDNHTLIINKESLKVEINPLFKITPSVHDSTYSNQDIDYNIPPKNASILTGMHLAADQNYLYVWVNDRWKRCLLSVW
jgi:hypothetical protein